MKKIIYILFLLLVCTVADAAPKVKDPVVMTVGGMKVTRSEFEYFLNKNKDIVAGEQHTFDEYVDMYVVYKLKVAEALSRGIDTTQTYKDELETYRRQLVGTFQDHSYWQDSLVREIVVRIPYEVKASHILLMLDENAPDSLVLAKKSQILDIQSQIENGAPFDSLAMAYSDDPSGKMNGGDLGYFKMLQMVYPFEDAAFTTPIGEMTICRSQFGFHLIKVFDKRKISLEMINPAVVSLIEGHPDEQILAQLKQIVMNDDARIEKGLAMLEERFPESEIVKMPEYLSLYKEYHDGILLYEVANEEVWEKATRDIGGLTQHFEANREKYAFDSPRFKGAFIECVEDSLLVARMKEIYESNEMYDAAELVRNTVLTDSILTPNPRQPRFHIINGLFKVGDNPTVDERLGVASDKQIRDDMPVQMVFGRVIDAPESVDDVRNAVIAGYQEELEKAFVAKLRAKHKVTLDKKELEKIKNS